MPGLILMAYKGHETGTFYTADGTRYERKPFIYVKKRHTGELAGLGFQAV